MHLINVFPRRIFRYSSRIRRREWKCHDRVSKLDGAATRKCLSQMKYLPETNEAGGKNELIFNYAPLLTFRTNFTLHKPYARFDFNKYTPSGKYVRGKSTQLSPPPFLFIARYFTCTLALETVFPFIKLIPRPPESFKAAAANANCLFSPKMAATLIYYIFKFLRVGTAGKIVSGHFWGSRRRRGEENVADESGARRTGFSVSKAKHESEFESELEGARCFSSVLHTTHCQPNMNVKQAIRHEKFIQLFVYGRDNRDRGGKARRGCRCGGENAAADGTLARTTVEYSVSCRRDIVSARLVADPAQSLCRRFRK